MAYAEPEIFTSLPAKSVPIPDIQDTTRDTQIQKAQIQCDLVGR